MSKIKPINSAEGIRQRDEAREKMCKSVTKSKIFKKGGKEVLSRPFDEKELARLRQITANTYGKAPLCPQVKAEAKSSKSGVSSAPAQTQSSQEMLKSLIKSGVLQYNMLIALQQQLFCLEAKIVILENKIRKMESGI